MIPPDTALVSRTRDGDDEAFRALYERHRPAVERVCRKWLRDPHLVEDAVQATFVKAWRALPKFSGGENVDRWLKKIATNHCHDVWRGLARAEALGRFEGAALAADAGGGRLAGDCVDRLAVESMLRDLGRRDASLLIQRHVGETPVGALAVQWGLTKGAMEVALHRARLRARRLAAAEGLRGLLPLGLSQRLAAAFQRWTGLSAEASGVLAGICGVVLAVGLAVPLAQSPPSGGEHRAVAPAEDVADVHAVSLRAAELQLLATLGSPDAPAGALAGARAAGGEGAGGPAAVATAPSRRHGSVVPFEPVVVPATGTSIRSTPDYEEPHWVVGVRVGEDTYSVEEGGPQVVEEIEPVVETGCRTADPHTVVYCEE